MTAVQKSRRSKLLQSRVVLLCASLGAVALCTWLAFLLQFELATAGFLYLVLVVLAAIYAGFGVATVTSLVSVACLNYFFAPPIFTFRVNSLHDWVALCAFEFTALVVSRLSDAVNRKRAEANAERRDSERLYETSRRILLFDKARHPGLALTSLLAEVFELDAVVLFDAEATETYATGPGSPEREERARDAYCRDANEFDSALSTWYCAVRLDARPIGGLVLAGGTISPLVASALASLCAIAIERSRSMERECRAEAARESEQLRAAVLDALAHDFKTPVAAIWAASSGMLALGGLTEVQTELLTLVDEQSRKLNDLSTRLLGTARLDSTNFEPQYEPLLLSVVAHEVVQTIASAPVKSRFRFFTPANESPVWVDRKLVSAALAQLADNAIKYSVPGSSIDFSLYEKDGKAIVSVRNQGVPIKPSDRERIFERFYRADVSGNGPGGTGLGLSIVKKIAEAHCGQAWVESGPHLGTAFSMAFPLMPSHAVEEDPEPFARKSTVGGE